MNTSAIKGNWNVTKGKLKQKYAQLTDDDLIYVDGKEDELLGRIQKRTGLPRSDIESFLTDECECDLGAEGSSRDDGQETNRSVDRGQSAYKKTGATNLRRAPGNPSINH